MRRLIRTGSVVLAGVLGAGAMSIAAADTASAATCQGPRYPSGACQVFFDRGEYFRGQTAHFHSDRAFRGGETVDGYLRCRHNFTRYEGPYTAGRRGRVYGSFTVPRRAPYGTCTFTLVGRRSGSTARGSFLVKRRSAAATGSSTAGAHLSNSALSRGSAAAPASVLGESMNRSITKSAPATSATSGSLPFTGSAYVAPMVGGGILLLAVGGGLLVVVRRRSAHTPA